MDFIDEISRQGRADSGNDPGNQLEGVRFPSFTANNNIWLKMCLHRFVKCGKNGCQSPGIPVRVARVHLWQLYSGAGAACMKNSHEDTFSAVCLST